MYSLKSNITRTNQLIFRGFYLPTQVVGALSACAKKSDFFRKSLKARLTTPENSRVKSCSRSQTSTYILLEQQSTNNPQCVVFWATRTTETFIYLTQ